MSDFGADGEPVHSDAASVQPAWPHQRLDGPRWLEWRRIMHKTNHTEKTRELTEAELSTVSGGITIYEAMISGVIAGPAAATPAPGDPGVTYDLKKNWTA